MGLVSVVCPCSGHYEASVPYDSRRNIYKGQLYYTTDIFHAHTLACIHMLDICIAAYVWINFTNTLGHLRTQVFLFVILVLS